MNTAVKMRNEALSVKLIKNLTNRQFEAYYCKTKEDALNQVLSLIASNEVVSWGGSVSLEEIGILSKLIEEGYQVIDRSQAKNASEKMEMSRQALLCDTYLMSSNAISEDGVLFNVDGNGNRVAALTFGPKSVIVVVGMNKVCKTNDAALIRARTVASPINAQRVASNSSKQSSMPCVLTGSCSDCMSKDCICSTIVETRMSNNPGRIKVVLVEENLGF